MRKHLTDQQVQNLCIQTAKKLVTVPHVRKKLPATKRPIRLVFPEYMHGKKKKTRISEQELRQCFCQTLERINLDTYYSLETPTQEKMKGDRITKSVGRSGSTDLSIYLPDDRDRLQWDLVVEFKHGNPPIDAVKHDLVKLTNERHSGLYFHLLESVDSRTLSCTNESGLLAKILSGLTYKHSATKSRVRYINKFIVIAVIVLNARKLLMKTVKETDYRLGKDKEIISRLVSMLSIDYNATTKGMTVLKPNKWRVVDL
ncbi:hypothetical protein ACFLSQ_04210 [Bacteroidota bacterium]